MHIFQTKLIVVFKLLKIISFLLEFPINEFIICLQNFEVLKIERINRDYVFDIL